MFVGEAPGFHEDKQGFPFVGQAGKLLDQLLGGIGLSRDLVFVANVLKCRPPGNRDPMPDEIEACSKWLTRQIEIIDPKVIVTLGRHSMNRFIPGAVISRIHGVPREIDGRTVVPMFHPAAALHQERYRSMIVADFERLPQILAAAEERRAGAARPSAPPAEPAPMTAEQGRLF
jgi:uracil-DNA glycosylase